MADSKITDLSDGAPIQSGDEFVVARSGANNKIAGSALPGFEIGYDQITSNGTPTGSSEGTATTIITCAAHTFDGGLVLVSFGSSFCRTGNTTGDALIIGLFESGTLINRFGQLSNPSGGTFAAPIYGAFRFTPSAASHTYTVGAWVPANGGGAALVAAGAGGAGNNPPAYARFTKV